MQTQGSAGVTLVLCYTLLHSAVLQYSLSIALGSCSCEIIMKLIVQAEIIEIVCLARRTSPTQQTFRNEYLCTAGSAVQWASHRKL